MASSKQPYPKLPARLILTSSKSYFSPARSLAYLTSLLDPDEGIIPLSHPDVLLGFIPDFLTIYPSTQILNTYTTQSKSDPDPTPAQWPLQLGAQDCFWEKDHGAYTGEVVPAGLQALGVSIVELGHAERRKMLAETNETTAKKAAAASACGMVPLVCIGEVEKPGNGPMSASIGNAMRQLRPQIESVLLAVPADAPVILAYEPVWAIGVAQPAGVDYIGPVIEAIRDVVKGVQSKSGRSGQTKVIYGGSAGPGLWSGQANGGNGLGKYADGIFLGRFAHEISNMKKVVDEVIASME